MKKKNYHGVVLYRRQSSRLIDDCFATVPLIRRGSRVREGAGRGSRCDGHVSSAKPHALGPRGCRRPDRRRGQHAPLPGVDEV